MKTYLRSRLPFEWRTVEQIERDSLLKKIRVQSILMYVIAIVALTDMVWVSVSVLSSWPVNCILYISPYVNMMACIGFVKTWMRRDLLIQKKGRYRHIPKYVLVEKAFPDIYRRKDKLPQSKYRYFAHRVDKMRKRAYNMGY